MFSKFIILLTLFISTAQASDELVEAPRAAHAYTAEELQAFGPNYQRMPVDIRGKILLHLKEDRWTFAKVDKANLTAYFRYCAFADDIMEKLLSIKQFRKLCHGAGFFINPPELTNQEALRNIALDTLKGKQRFLELVGPPEVILRFLGSKNEIDQNFISFFIINYTKYGVFSFMDYTNNSKLFSFEHSLAASPTGLYPQKLLDRLKNEEERILLLRACGIDWSSRPVWEGRSTVEALERIKFRTTNLDLHYTSLMDRICKLKHVKGLDLERACLHFLPEKLFNASQLKALDISLNPLLELPSSITQLTNLTILMANKCLLTSLPDGFSNLTSLRNLQLQDNLLQKLPEDFCDTVGLEKLNLSANKIAQLPEGFSRLVNLVDLKLDSSCFPLVDWPATNTEKIRGLPIQICQLKKLHKLEINTHIPLSIPGEIRNLRANLVLILNREDGSDSGSQVFQMTNIDGQILDPCQFGVEHPERVNTPQQELCNNQHNPLICKNRCRPFLLSTHFMGTLAQDDSLSFDVIIQTGKRDDFNGWIYRFDCRQVLREVVSK